MITIFTWCAIYYLNKDRTKDRMLQVTNVNNIIVLLYSHRKINLHYKHYITTYYKLYMFRASVLNLCNLFCSNTKEFPIDEENLAQLHTFAQKNPIYLNSFEKNILDIPCMVYEGDINDYWLNSIKHGSSCQPFYPTWIMSAYVSVLLAKKLGYLEVIDIGSGDGRIAFCAKVLDLESYSVEIDDMLVDLQKLLIILDFHPYCSDATIFDYSSLNLTLPIFFIGGLAQMGGTALALGVLEKTNSISNLKNVGWVFAGTYSQKYQPDPKNEAGWGTLIEKNNLKSIQCISLPTVWTFHEPDETPYIFAQRISD